MVSKRTFAPCLLAAACLFPAAAAAEAPAATPAAPEYWAMAATAVAAPNALYPAPTIPFIACLNPPSGLPCW